MTPSRNAIDEYVLLVGQPPITDHLQFIRTMTADGHSADRAALAEEWRAANKRLHELESTEGGWAADPPLRRLPAHLSEFAEAQLREVAAKQVYRFAPHHWSLVELDRLIVYQKYINVTFVEEIERALGPDPTEEDLARVAVGHGPHRPEIQVRQINDTTYTFSCASKDLRCLNTAILSPDMVQGYQPAGHASAILGLFVGFGVNFLSALHFQGRLILLNGSHRAYALRKRGVTHAPCLIQEITREDELDLLGIAETRQKFERYAKMPRPPLFKDYFDPQLSKRIPVPRSQVMLQLQFTTQYIRAPGV